jgi:hypothetical protein
MDFKITLKTTNDKELEKLLIKEEKLVRKLEKVRKSIKDFEFNFIRVQP